METLCFIFLESTGLLLTRQKIQILFNMWTGKYWWLDKPDCKGAANHQPSALFSVRWAAAWVDNVVVVVNHPHEKSVWGGWEEITLFWLLIKAVPNEPVEREMILKFNHVLCKQIGEDNITFLKFCDSLSSLRIDHISPSCLHEGGHWIKTKTARMEEQMRASE